jgi:signal transduction histidine kinase
MLVFMLKSNETLDDAGHELVQQIDHQIERMREFVMGVLDLAKLETGRALSIEPLPMVHYLRSIVQDFQPRANEKQIALGFTASDADIVAEFDPVEIRRVVENLLSNAIKFTPSNGEIMVTIDLNDEVIIRVSDTGVGIPQAAIPHVFDRFFRVNNEAHRAVDGTGLGLAIAKSIIEQHSGKIWVESVEGQGSTFSFNLQTSRESGADDSKA